MATKGVNTLVSEVKKGIVDAVNKGLNDLPISVIDLLLDGITSEIKNQLTLTLQQEQQEYEETVSIEQNQIVYNEEETARLNEEQDIQQPIEVV